jgi:hypothetical protein
VFFVAESCEQQSENRADRANAGENVRVTKHCVLNRF